MYHNENGTCRSQFVFCSLLCFYARHTIEKKVEGQFVITADNGSEFCGHELVAEKLKANIYFAKPYSSWEHGLNENFNGLLRQYIRKGTDLRTVTDKQISEIEQALNARPRKCLGFRQPIAVFDELRKAA